MLVKVAMMAALATAPAAARRDAAGLGHACFEAARQERPPRSGLKACTRALEQPQQVRDRAATYVNRGIVQIHRRHVAEALADYDSALAVMPEFADALVNKGIALSTAGREREAVDTFTSAIYRQPQHPEIAYYMRGRANEILGRTRAAYEDYSQAVALAPDWPEPAVELRRFSVTRRTTAQG